jgi:hypothetical protein
MRFAAAILPSPARHYPWPAVARHRRNTLAACCSVDCGPDWFAVGQRDGRINAGEQQIERYAARCGGPVDRQRYLEGYRDGFDQRPPPMM